MQNRKADGISLIKIISDLLGMLGGSVAFQWIWCPEIYTWGLSCSSLFLLITTLLCFQKACGMCSIWIWLLIRMCWRHPLSTNVHPTSNPCCQESPYQWSERKKEARLSITALERKTKWECYKSDKYIINMDTVSIKVENWKKKTNWVNSEILFALAVRFFSWCGPSIKHCSIYEPGATFRKSPEIQDTCEVFLYLTPLKQTCSQIYLFRGEETTKEKTTGAAG